VTDAVKVTLYGTEHCSYCLAARMLLTKKGIDFDEVSVSRDATMRRRMEDMSGRRTVPQIFIGERAIGGFEELDALDRDGTLDRLLGRTDDCAPQ